MDNTEIIRLLNDDIRLEHGAIIQYLQHAYVLGEGEVRTGIEEIAREEMYHLQWLSEMVAHLGGVPSLERGEVFLDAPEPSGLMALNFAAEEGAIRQYLDHITRIDDPKVVSLIERILQDEREHQGEFTSLKEQLALMPPAEALPFSPEGPQGVETPAIDGLNEAFHGEYSTMVQYLRQAFVGFSCPDQRRMSDLSIEAMKHMGWLAERMVDLGGKPNPMPLPTPSPEAPQAASLKRLGDLKQLYGRILPGQDLATRDLIQRIQGQESYQETFFQEPDLHPESKEPVPAWTVGGLKGRAIGADR